MPSVAVERMDSPRTLLFNAASLLLIKCIFPKVDTNLNTDRTGDDDVYISILLYNRQIIYFIDEAEAICQGCNICLFTSKDLKLRLLVLRDGHCHILS